MLHIRNPNTAATATDIDNAIETGIKFYKDKLYDQSFATLNPLTSYAESRNADILFYIALSIVENPKKISAGTKNEIASNIIKQAMLLRRSNTQLTEQEKRKLILTLTGIQNDTTGKQADTKHNKDQLIAEIATLEKNDEYKESINKYHSVLCEDTLNIELWFNYLYALKYTKPTGFSIPIIEDMLVWLVGTEGGFNHRIKFFEDVKELNPSDPMIHYKIGWYRLSFLQHLTAQNKVLAAAINHQANKLTQLYGEYLNDLTLASALAKRNHSHQRIFCSLYCAEQIAKVTLEEQRVLSLLKDPKAARPDVKTDFPIENQQDLIIAQLKAAFLLKDYRFAQKFLDNLKGSKHESDAHLILALFYKERNQIQLGAIHFKKAITTYQSVSLADDDSISLVIKTYQRFIKDKKVLKDYQSSITKKESVNDEKHLTEPKKIPDKAEINAKNKLKKESNKKAKEEAKTKALKEAEEKAAAENAALAAQVQKQAEYKAKKEAEKKLAKAQKRLAKQQSAVILVEDKNKLEKDQLAAKNLKRISHKLANSIIHESVNDLMIEACTDNLLNQSLNELKTEKIALDEKLSIQANIIFEVLLTEITRENLQKELDVHHFRMPIYIINPMNKLAENEIKLISSLTNQSTFLYGGAVLDAMLGNESPRDFDIANPEIITNLKTVLTKHYEHEIKDASVKIEPTHRPTLLKFKKNKNRFDISAECKMNAFAEHHCSFTLSSMTHTLDNKINDTGDCFFDLSHGRIRLKNPEVMYPKDLSLILRSISLLSKMKDFSANREKEIEAHPTKIFNTPLDKLLGLMGKKLSDISWHIAARDLQIIKENLKHLSAPNKLDPAFVSYFQTRLFQQNGERNFLELLKLGVIDALFGPIPEKNIAWLCKMARKNSSSLMSAAILIAIACIHEQEPTEYAEISSVCQFLIARYPYFKAVFEKDKTELMIAFKLRDNVIEHHKAKAIATARSLLVTVAKNSGSPLVSGETALKSSTQEIIIQSPKSVSHKK